MCQKKQKFLSFLFSCNKFPKSPFTMFCQIFMRSVIEANSHSVIHQKPLKHIEKTNYDEFAIFFIFSFSLLCHLHLEFVWIIFTRTFVASYILLYKFFSLCAFRVIIIVVTITITINVIEVDDDDDDKINKTHN